MAEIPGLDSDVWFGEVENELPDWRLEEVVDEDDPDDELLPETPEDVIDILGFDPREFE